MHTGTKKYSTLNDIHYAQLSTEVYHKNKKTVIEIHQPVKGKTRKNKVVAKKTVKRMDLRSWRSARDDSYRL